MSGAGQLTQIQTPKLSSSQPLEGQVLLELTTAKRTSAVRLYRLRGAPPVLRCFGGRAQRLAQVNDPSHRYLALIWRHLGDLDKAKHHALEAYRWAWADGEPYVNRYALTKATELLHELKVPIPGLPPYVPADHPPFSWEAEIRAAIEKIRTEKANEDD